MKSAVDAQARIISIEEEQGGVTTALLLAPEIAQRAKPMQFVQVKVGTGTDPYLRRPFGISRICRESGLIAVTWAVVGRGTAMMAEWKVDDVVSVLGPLGNGFELPEGAAQPETVWLIAGGTGLVPLYPLAEVLAEQGSKVTLFYGARSSALKMDTSRFEELGCTVRICTEDGSEGIKGFVTEALKEALAARSGGKGQEAEAAPVAVACGPTPMLSAVKNLLSGSGIGLYVSLEGHMACGTGLCKGCAVKAAPPREDYLHVCSDGPVFPANDVVLGGES